MATELTKKEIVTLPKISYPKPKQLARKARNGLESYVPRPSLSSRIPEWYGNDLGTIFFLYVSYDSVNLPSSNEIKQDQPHDR